MDSSLWFFVNYKNLFPKNTNSPPFLPIGNALASGRGNEPISVTFQHQFLHKGAPCEFFSLRLHLRHLLQGWQAPGVDTGAFLPHCRSALPPGTTPPPGLKHSKDMTAEGWQFTWATRFNPPDTLLLVAGVIDEVRQLESSTLVSGGRRDRSVRHCGLLHAVQGREQPLWRDGGLVGSDNTPRHPQTTQTQFTENTGFSVSKNT